ncbi:MAG: glycosyltransferase family 4 protein [Candidatus Levyibacteriota bacterium]
MHILILNWRDPKNPRAGGAEKLNLEILKLFIEKGDSVIWYACAVNGLPQQEDYKGITIIRFGNIITHFLSWPFFLYAKKFGKVNLIIDCIHGIGYLSNLFAPFTKRRILVCEVAKNIWDEMIPFPGNFVGKFLEPIQFFLYASNKFWTISTSTKKDIEKMGVNGKNILVLPMGFDAPLNIKPEDKTKFPIALFVGRLANMKGIKDAIKAIHLANSNTKTKWTLNIVGRGTPDFEKELKDLVTHLKLDEQVNFLGYVSEQDKFKEMAKAWVLLVPSSREGWGMIVGEANYVRTQVIGYKSPGLIDSLVYYSKDNLLVNQQPENIAECLNKIEKPELIDSKLKPGWKDLQQVVIRDIT